MSGPLVGMLAVGLSRVLGHAMFRPVYTHPVR
jgi:hypothetical protein